MALLLCHLIGDYVLQSHVMATRKTASWRWAFIHATFYALPFALLLVWLGVALCQAALALFVIWSTHAVIDRLRIAARWCAWYGVGHPGLWFRPSAAEPTFTPPPPYLGVWLTIIVDNTMHLTINALTLWGLL